MAQILSVIPSDAKAGDTVTVEGKGFGKTQDKSTVQVDGVVLKVTEWSDTKIVGTLPDNVKAGKVEVTATVNQTASNTVQYVAADPRNRGIETVAHDHAAERPAPEGPKVRYPEEGTGTQRKAIHPVKKIE